MEKFARSPSTVVFKLTSTVGLLLFSYGNLQCKRVGSQRERENHRGITMEQRYGVEQNPRRASFLRKEILPSGQSLTVVLQQEATIAQVRNLRPFVYFYANWCGPCREIMTAMSNPETNRAFEGTYILKLNADHWSSDLLAGTGLTVPGVPIIYEIDQTGRPTGRRLEGRTWQPGQTAQLMANLRAFFADETSLNTLH